jgi:hypothetical protein
VVDGVKAGEPSALAHDVRRRAYASVVDDGVARLWSFVSPETRALSAA